MYNLKHTIIIDILYMNNSNNISRYMFSFFFFEEKRKQSFRDS